MSCTPTAGPGGGSSLARPAAGITVGEILLAIDGPLAAVRDLPPEQLVYDGHAPATCRRSGAGCTRASTTLLDGVSVADLAAATSAVAKI